MPELGHRTVWQFHPSPAKSSTSLAKEHDLMALKSSQGLARTQSLSGGGEQFWPKMPEGKTIRKILGIHHVCPCSCSHSPCLSVCLGVFAPLPRVPSPLSAAR